MPRNKHLDFELYGPLLDEWGRDESSSMTIFDITCICFRNAINADPNYVVVGSHWLRKWVTARSLATRPSRRGVGVDRLASYLLL